jgi:hypothetical protein
MVGLDGSCVSSRRTDLRLARRQERTDQPKKQAEKRAKVLALENFSVLSGFALSDLLSSEKNTEDSTEGVINHEWIPTVVLPGESR